jgi:hypothetical protein
MENRAFAAALLAAQDQKIGPRGLSQNLAQPVKDGDLEEEFGVKGFFEWSFLEFEKSFVIHGLVRI